MRRKQVSVFVENTPGRLEAILDALQNKNVSIRALSVSESAEFGIVRMILEDADRGQSALHESGFTTRIDDLLSYHMPDVAGGLLNTVIKPLADAGINIKYFYAYIEMGEGEGATVVFKPNDIDKAEAILKAQLGK
jgi:hypothetical protein